jgi:hypothetical protein
LKKYQQATLGELKLGDRFYFPGDARKRVFEVAAAVRPNVVRIIREKRESFKKPDEPVIFLRNNSEDR